MLSLARYTRQGVANPWAGARDGVILYAQNYRNLLKNAAWLTVIVWVLTLLIFILVFAPVAAVASLFPGVAGFWTFAIAVVTAFSLKAALIDPIAMTTPMLGTRTVGRPATKSPLGIQSRREPKSDFRTR